MIENKEKIYFEGLLLEKMRETVRRNNALLSLKEGECEKLSDLMDEATLDHNWHITLSLLEKNNVKIDGFKEALEKICEGTYGICEGCNVMISKKRLKLIPFARFCIDCQRENETKTM